MRNGYTAHAFIRLTDAVQLCMRFSACLDRCPGNVTATGEAVLARCNQELCARPIEDILNFESQSTLSDLCIDVSNTSY